MRYRLFANYKPSKEGKGEERGEFSLQSARIKRVDVNNWPEQFKKLSEYKFEGDHPLKEKYNSKCFIYVNTLGVFT
jgi:hypothetical protein